MYYGISETAGKINFYRRFSLSKRVQILSLNLRLHPAKGLLPGWHSEQLHKGDIFSVTPGKAPWNLPLQTTPEPTSSHGYVANVGHDILCMLSAFE